jgi:hypothetical protein
MSFFDVTGQVIYFTVASSVLLGPLPVGYRLGANFRQVEAYCGPVSYVVLAIIVVLYLWRIVTHKGQSATT